MHRIIQYLYEKKGVDLTWKEVAPLRERDTFHVLYNEEDTKIQRINDYQPPKYKLNERD